MSKTLCLWPTQKFSVVGTATDKSDVVVYHESAKEEPSLGTTANACIFLDINEPYTRRMIQSALRKRSVPTILGPGHGMDAVPLPENCDFQWSEYERIDWTAVLAGKHKASSYCIRKGLSRKAQLAHFTHLYICKHPQSFLKDALPQTIILDTWPVFEDTCDTTREGLADIVVGTAAGASGVNRRELLNKCLQEARGVMALAEKQYMEQDGDSPPPIFILKPSTINKGAGIQIVHCYEQVVDFCWSESDIREWVLQRYISSPLLLRKRKFHIRAYALAVSAIRVYLSRDCLALCSGRRYNANNTNNTLAHITNTAHQEVDPNFKEEDCILQWNDPGSVAPILVRDGTCRRLQEAHEKVEHVMNQMQRITAEVFRAYKNEFGAFAPIEGCFEHYGLDFMIDKDWHVYLLEINPGPDFKQTGSRLSRIVENFMVDTIDAVFPEYSASSGGTTNSPTQPCGNLVCVYEHQMRGGKSITKEFNNLRVLFCCRDPVRPQFNQEYITTKAFW